MSNSPTLEEENNYWKKGSKFVCGVDEVGRGAWAGPVSVGAFVLDPAANLNVYPYNKVKDSKKLTKQVREELYEPLKKVAIACTVYHTDNTHIDQKGLTSALQNSARNALLITNKICKIDIVLLDGPHDYIKLADFSVKPIVKGDLSSLAIACASIVAKVERDRLMVNWQTKYPQYAFSSNVGYPSLAHREALKRLGPTSLHRTSWAFMDKLGGRVLPGAFVFPESEAIK